jgi:beta-lactamase regulating signal transducer with metallopeptidase domain
VAVWTLGVLLTLLPLGRGLAALWGLTLRGNREEGLVWSSDLDVPVTFARTILLPRAARDWPARQRQAALLHERAHMDRGDWWVHMLAWVSCALLWFHPLAWWARRQLMLEAERAADDRVVLAGVQPSAYAQQLLGLAGSPGVGLGMGPSNTAVRVRAILGAPNRSVVRWPAVVVSLVLICALAGPVTAFAAWTPPGTPHCDVLGAQP